MEGYDVVIIGAGSAGYTAGIYATRYGLRTLIIGAEPGGQVNEAYEIDNYPGFLSVNGAELMKKFREHTEKLGAKLLISEVKDVRKEGEKFLVKAGGEEYAAKSVILATGSKKRKLGLPGEDELRGRGISYCATCDAPFFRDKTVGVIGGGNSAVKAAILLAEHAKKVYLVYRRKKENMKAMPFWIRKAEENEKVEMIFEARPKEIRGKEKLEAVVFDQKGKDIEIKMDGLFIEIGTEPENALAKKLGVSLDERGKIEVKNDMSTNIEGVFAAGDVTNASNDFEQIVTACAEGAIAAKSVYEYVKGKSKL